jgi:hypothetical protein
VDKLIAKAAKYGELYISDVTAETLHRVASNTRKE